MSDEVLRNFGVPEGPIAMAIYNLQTNLSKISVVMESKTEKAPIKHGCRGLARFDDTLSYIEAKTK